MSHYFETPTAAGPQFNLTLRLWDRTVELVSAPGVFSGRRLDPGTAVLLRTCPPPTGPGRLLDLGCGIGPIALALASHCPQAEIAAIDVNRRAVELTALNAARLGLSDRLWAGPPEAVDPTWRFDQIWSNPPIRIGKAALRQLLTDWLGRLTDQGQAFLVVARHLGADSLAAWLAGQGWDCQRLASAKGYRVLRLARPES
ncbi:MAG: methyltransferase [Propionibacteriaceae bacterium]|jgi:16S rRNA G1207 methylase RsmC|nr:methyltransferase [Propionibacteriaceae bacterium]